jgi:8-oxo-dGTP pyrophosphatase MutT (NUDIX family)
MSHSQKYKVFVNEKPLTISTQPEEGKSLNRILNIQFDHRDLLNTYLSQFKLGCYEHMHLFGENPEAIFNDFINEFTLIEAAGGLVLDKNGKALLIFRKGKWDLPKGKIDHGESPEEAAVREVSEECGISTPIITDALEETWHTYEINGKPFLKKTYWYKMKPQSDGEETKPQLEEDITQCLWLERKDFVNKMEINTYPAIANLLIKYW